MPRSRNKKPPLQLIVTGLRPLPPEVETWERQLVVPVFKRLFAASKPTASQAGEVHGADAR